MDSMQNTINYMGGVSLDLDLTVLIQLLLVVLLMFILKRWVFKPYLSAIDERAKRTSATRASAEQLQQEADDIATRYETALADARTAALDAKLTLRTEGIETKDAIVSAARKEANSQIESAQAQIEEQVASERAALDERVDELAGLVVQKVIGRSAS